MYHVFRGTEQLAQAGSRGFSILSAVRRGGNQVAKLPRRGRDLRGADGSVPNLRQEKQAQGVRSARRVPGPNELTCRGGWQGWQVDKGASRGVRDEGRRCLSLLGRQRAHDDSVVMVKNEEIVRSSVSALEYRALMESDGGKMGGAVTGWLRIGKGGVHGLGTFSNFAAGRVFERIIGTPRSKLDTAGRAAAERRLGVMSFTCEPGALHSMLAENLRVAEGEMEARLGGDAEAASALREEGMVALAVVAWGSAPAQQGGRAAERRYTDLVVHLTPASDSWETPDLALEVVPPRGDAQKWSWARRGRPMEAAAVASGPPLEYAEEVAVEEQGRFKAPLQSTLAVRCGGALTLQRVAHADDAVVAAAARLAAERGLAVTRGDLYMDAMGEWDEVLLLGPATLCASAAVVDVRGGNRWQRSGAEFESGMIAAELRAALRDLVDSGGA